MQDDYLDCYGDPQVTGKIGSDIEDNKCSWLVNRALALCDARQRTQLEENYGRNDGEKVRNVKRVYDELNLKDEYLRFEEDSHREIMALIDRTTGTLPKRMFTDFVEKIYRRQK